MLQALGFGLLDHTGQQIGRGGGKLASLHSVDSAMLDPRIAEVDFQVVTDVTNPLLGERGAAAVFAPQKGASASAIEALEAGLTRFARLLDSKRAAEPGTGAGGGLAYGAMVGLGARLHSGARWMMTLTHWESVIEGADLVITGEGSFDQQSLEGKITGVVIQQATARSVPVPVVVVCGVNQLEKPPAGVSVIQLSDWSQDTESSFTRAAELLENVGRQIADAI
jgi:glycerate kinase